MVNKPWTRVRLAEVADVASGVGFPTAYQGEKDGSFPFYKVSDMNLPGNEVRMKSHNNAISDEVRKKLRAKPFPAGAVIFPKIGAAIATNKKRILTCPACADNNVMAVLPREEALLPEFLFYLFSRKNLSDFASDSNPPSIRKTEVEDWEVSIPSLDEQRRIVDILNHAASIRRLRDDARAKVKEIVPALFVEMFGNPATNPKAWECKQVGDVISGADYGSSKKCSEMAGRIPVIRMGNVAATGELLLGDLKYADFDGQEFEKLRLEQGDILFNRTNSKELVGKTGLWDGRFDAVAASYFIRVRVRRDLVHPTYFWAFFNGPYMKRRLYETARGAIGQANINAKELKAFPIPVPPVDIQQAFADRIAEVEGMAALQDRAAMAAEQTAQSLLSQVFDQGPSEAAAETEAA